MDRRPALSEAPTERTIAPGGCAPGVLVRLPDPVERPLLALFLFERDIKPAEFGEMLGEGVTGAAVSYWCRPFHDPERRAPRKATRQRIAAVTDGAVPPWSFDPPSKRERRT